MTPEEWEARRRQQLEARAKAAARRAWTGSAADFDRAWPAMYEQMQREDQAIDRDVARWGLL